MRIQKLTVVSALSLVLFASGQIRAGQVYRIDPAWSHVEFSVKNFAVNTVEGRFQTFQGTVFLNEADVTQSSVTVSVGIKSIDTGNKKRDLHLQAPEFFDSATFPDMIFQSKRIESDGAGYRLVGTLTMKGHSNEIVLPFTFNVEKSAQGSSTLHAEARGALNRHDYGIDSGSNFSVGKDVQIILHIQATSSVP